jgi:metal-responsive CopG/Arc/MetJ family transcriptional regulator
MPSRNISISLPEEMLCQAEQLAAREQRTLSELFREAFRVYRAQQIKSTPEHQKEQELARISQQIRAELQADQTETE